MEAEWDPVLLEISDYKDTGTYIMKSGEETAQMLDDHIVMTQVGREVFCWCVQVPLPDSEESMDVA